MKTLLDVLQRSIQFLEGKTEAPRRVSERLMSSLLGCKRMDLYLRFDQPLLEEELAQLRKWIRRASLGEPIEYITEEIEFFGKRIKTDKRALIPRVETEILVEMIAKDVKGKETLFDLCTGTGCIGISLKGRFPGLKVSLSDISLSALDLARENGKGMDIEILQGDLFEPFLGKKADIIVCNPPYVSEKEYSEVDVSVRDFEPKLALVGGFDGLHFYRRLERAHEFLNEGGKLFLEIGFSQGKKVEEIFHSPFWKNQRIHQDLSGKDRFFSLEKQ